MTNNFRMHTHSIIAILQFFYDTVHRYSHQLSCLWLASEKSFPSVFTASQKQGQSKRCSGPPSDSPDQMLAFVMFARSCWLK
jgi:hypothetical protein